MSARSPSNVCVGFSGGSAFLFWILVVCVLSLPVLLEVCQIGLLFSPCQILVSLVFLFFSVLNVIDFCIHLYYSLLFALDLFYSY